MKLLPRLFIIFDIRKCCTVSVDCLNHRHIFTIAQIITCSGKERSNRVYRAPLVIVSVIKGKCHKKRCPVHIRHILIKLPSSVPHHRTEILLKIRIALIISSGLVLRVILIVSGKRRGFHTSGFHNKIIFTLNRINHLRRYKCRIIKQHRCYRKEGNIYLRGFFPLGAFKFRILFIALIQHTVRKGGKITCKMIFLNVPHKISKIYMICVHQRINRYKVRYLQIPVHLI